MSTNPEYIDCYELNLNNLNEGDIIYICGHGANGKIAGREFSDLACKLVSRGYKGVQDIYITSCESKGIIDKNLKESLIEELKKVNIFKSSFEVESRI